MSRQVKVDNFIIDRIVRTRSMAGTCAQLRGCLLETAINTLISIERQMDEVEAYIKRQEADMDAVRERETINVVSD